MSWWQCLGSVDVVAPGVVMRKTGSWVRAALPGLGEQREHSTIHTEENVSFTCLHAVMQSHRVSFKYGS